MRKKLIRGAGGGGKGGGGGGRTPQESKDTLVSKSYARVVDLLSEGEIEGLVDGFKSIYLDETPILSASGQANFTSIDAIALNGTQEQDYIPLPGISGVENEVQVVTQVQKASPITRSLSNLNLTHLRVTIGIPQLSYQNPNNGDLGGTTVDYKIYIQSNGGGFVQKVTWELQGKAMSRYQKSHLLELDGDGPWDVKVERVTDDSAQTNLRNDIYLDSYTEIISTKLRYPNSALVGIRIDAEQFRSIPRRGYECKGIKVQVPLNYDEETREYAGTWDGTFKTRYTNNPAWIFYDLVTNTRYGLGNYISEDQVDKWALYEIGRYSDEFISDGFGNTEPRFTCNMYLQTRAEAHKVIQDLASCFRSMVFWAGGMLTAVQDAPQDPVALFTPANVAEGFFTYSGASAKARHTVALVSWNDPDDFYRQKIEYVEDQDAIVRYGVIETELYAIGCTSRGQAHRVGKWLLYTEQNESETVQFKTGLEGAVVQPGQVIKVADPVKAGTRLGGRVSSATTTQITVDAELSVPNGTMYVVLPDGTVESGSIQSVAGRVVTLFNPLSQAPNSQAIWIISATSVEAQTFRVLQMTESDDGTFDVTAVRHEPNKFDAIEQGLVLEPRDISVLSLVPDSVTNALLTESLYESSSEVRVKLTASWQRAVNAASYLVQYRQGEGNWFQLPETNGTDIDILDVQPAVYTVQIVSISAIGKRSRPTEVSKEVIGKVAAPSDMDDFSLMPLAGKADVSWTKASDLDVLIGGTVRIRWTPATSDQDWNNAIDIIPALPGNSTRSIVPLLAGTYMGKFVDSSGVSSQNAALIVTTIPEALELNVIETLTENPTFAGSKTDCEAGSDGDGDYLTLSSAALIDDLMAPIDSLPTIDIFGNVAETATYLFDNSLDLEEVFTSRVTANIAVECYSAVDLLDFRTDLIDDWIDFDGSLVDDVFATLYVRTTLDDPAGTPTWTQWKQFVIGEYTARGYEFKLQIDTLDVTHNIKVRELEVVVDMADRVDTKRNITSNVGTTSVTFNYPFFAVPAVAITADNLTTGDFFQITNKTESGFDIVFKNSLSTNVSRDFDFLAKGYGRRVS